MSRPFAAMHHALFAILGIDATVRRGDDPPAVIRVIVRDGIARLGEFQQVIGRARHVCALRAAWLFQRGDVVSVLDRTQTVEAIVADDGTVVEAVLHG